MRRHVQTNTASAVTSGSQSDRVAIRAPMDSASTACFAASLMESRVMVGAFVLDVGFDGGGRAVAQLSHGFGVRSVARLQFTPYAASNVTARYTLFHAGSGAARRDSW